MSRGLGDVYKRQVPATEEAVGERIQEIGASEQSWKSVSVLTDKLLL